MSNETLKQHPCENCDLWKGCAIAFNMHFGSEGCPFKCDEYYDWKCRTKEKEAIDAWNRRAGDEGKHE